MKPSRVRTVYRLRLYALLSHSIALQEDLLTTYYHTTYYLLHTIALQEDLQALKRDTASNASLTLSASISSAVLSGMV